MNVWKTRKRMTALLTVLLIAVSVLLSGCGEKAQDRIRYEIIDGKIVKIQADEEQVIYNGYDEPSSVPSEAAAGDTEITDGIAWQKEEYNSLRDDFIETGDIFVKNSINYPPFEVNYEQSIVSPAVSYLLDLYLATGIEKYLDEGKRQLPLLEAFAGQQPSYHLNDISIRHWDGYWFGKREMWGDVFPHYWSNCSAWAFHLYSLCTQDQSYQKRAENIVRNNMCQFFEDGRASCAYIYPRMVDGVDGEFYDPYANDQDWALVYYYDILFEKP